MTVNNHKDSYKLEFHTDSKELCKLLTESVTHGNMAQSLLCIQIHLLF